MYFALTSEQVQLQASIVKFLAGASPLSRVRKYIDDPAAWDSETWARLNSQLGLPGLAIPEGYGGAGAGFVELALAFEALGASLACTPHLSTLGLATRLLLDCPDEEVRAELLGLIAAGETTATFAYLEDGGSEDLETITLDARPDGDRSSLTGAKRWVLDGATSDHILVAGRSAAGISMYLVDADAAGLTRTVVPSMDPTRNLADLSFSGTPARLLGDDGQAREWIEKSLAAVGVLLAAEQVGGARRSLEMAVSYAKVRVQFGRPIGSFQAIKHKCANILIELEQAQAAVHYAAWALDSSSSDALLVASVAKSFASDAYMVAASENMQVHGGMGFTWECDAHLYFKRAKTTSLLLGSPAYHREKIASGLGW